MKKQKGKAKPQDADLRARSKQQLTLMRKRRSARAFSPCRIPQSVIEDCIAIAASGPSGANMQPWSFVLVKDKRVKRRIRAEAEKAERIFYSKVSEEWGSALTPMKIDASKPFLEQAPYIICIFAQDFGLDYKGNKRKHYYVTESVGIATGLLISSLHRLGLSTLTYTPSPMGFLTKTLDRPPNERPLLILAVGHKDPTYRPPKLRRKGKKEYLVVV